MWQILNFLTINIILSLFNYIITKFLIIYSILCFYGLISPLMTRRYFYMKKYKEILSLTKKKRKRNRIPLPSNSPLLFIFDIYIFALVLFSFIFPPDCLVIYMKYFWANICAIAHPIICLREHIHFWFNFIANVSGRMLQTLC